LTVDFTCCALRSARGGLPPLDIVLVRIILSSSKWGNRELYDNGGGKGAVLEAAPPAGRNVCCLSAEGRGAGAAVRPDRVAIRRYRYVRRYRRAAMQRAVRKDTGDEGYADGGAGPA